MQFHAAIVYVLIKKTFDWLYNVDFILEGNSSMIYCTVVQEYITYSEIT